MTGVEAVTSAELLDSGGNVLTASTIYVPAGSNVILKRIIPVTEGVSGNG